MPLHVGTRTLCKGEGGSAPVHGLVQRTARLVDELARELVVAVEILQRSWEKNITREQGWTHAV